MKKKEYTPDKIIGDRIDDSYNNDYEYGKNREQLVPGLNYPKPATANTPYFGNFTISATGNIAVTGCPFKPTLVEFNISDNGSSTGIGQMTETIQYSNFCDTAGPTGLSTQTLCLWLQVGGVNWCLATFVSMDSGGFTINVGTYGGTSLVHFKCT